jgi:hypothetical protein
VIEDLAKAAHFTVKGALPGVSEWRVADVMHEGQGFREINVQSQGRSYRSCNLRYLDRVRQPVAEMVRTAMSENLRLALKAPKGARMDYAITVALEVRAVPMRWFRKTASA